MVNRIKYNQPSTQTKNVIMKATRKAKTFYTYTNMQQHKNTFKAIYHNSAQRNNYPTCNKLTCDLNILLAGHKNEDVA